MFERKQLVRPANRVQDALGQIQKNRHLEILTRIHHFSNQLQDLTDMARKLDKCLGHHWLLAAQRCRDRIHRQLFDLPYSLSQLQTLAHTKTSDPPTLSFLVEELVPIQACFLNL